MAPKSLAPHRQKLKDHGGSQAIMGCPAPTAIRHSQVDFLPPLSNISLCCSLSVQCFVLLSARKLSCWVACPSAVEESTFRNKKKRLVTAARYIAWTSQFPAIRSCEMCWRNALRMHCTTWYWRGLSVMLQHLKRNHQIPNEPAAVHLPHHKPCSLAIWRTFFKNQQATSELQISKSNQVQSSAFQQKK